MAGWEHDEDSTGVHADARAGRATPVTLAALSQPILHHQDPAFLALYGETAELCAAPSGRPATR